MKMYERRVRRNGRVKVHVSDMVYQFTLTLISVFCLRQRTQAFRSWRKRGVELDGPGKENVKNLPKDASPRSETYNLISSLACQDYLSVCYAPAHRYHE